MKCSGMLKSSDKAIRAHKAPVRLIHTSALSPRSSAAATRRKMALRFNSVMAWIRCRRRSVEAESPSASIQDTTARSKQSPSEAAAAGLSDDGADSYQPDPMTKRETLELVRAYYRITDPKLRRRLFDMTKALAAASSTKS